jgi:16S rRNA (guanine(527)-N(7))-methyltransferase GidB
MDVPGLDVSRETLDRLEVLIALVQKWTKRINLIAGEDPQHSWTRHVRDSAQLLPLAPSCVRIWADLGSGGGFPGLVLASLFAGMSNPPVMHLVESDQRKAAFLRTAVRELSLDATIHAIRIESLAPLHADVISARALAPLPRLLDLSHRHLSTEGVALFPKGRNRFDEISEARRRWTFELSETASITEKTAAILKLERITLA